MKHWINRGTALLALVGLFAAPALASYPENYDVQNTNGDTSPSPRESRINNYINQDEQINLLPTDGLVKVLRTDQKVLVNDFITRTFPVRHATVRELRNVVRRMVAIEGGRAEALINKDTKEAYIQVVAPEYMMPYLADAIASLDVQWLKEYWDGAADIYLKVQHREAALVDRIASNYAGTEGFSNVDTTNNALRRFDEIYRNEKYVEAVKLVDIPCNQVELEVKIYEVAASNDLKIGVDWVAWQNGPGKHLWEFAVAGYKDSQRARGYTSAYDPFVNAGREVSSSDMERISKFDGSESYASVNYLMTSNFVDFLQSKGEARVINEQKLMLCSANTGNISALSQVVAITNNLNELNSVYNEYTGRIIQPSSIVRYNGPEGADGPNPARGPHVSPVYADALAKGKTALLVDKNFNGKLDKGEVVIIDGTAYDHDDILPGDEAPVSDSYPSSVRVGPTYDRQVDYRNVGQVGLSLELTPFVGLESMELAIDLELGDLNGIAPSGVPIINTRTVNTTVRLLDGQPYVLAGLTKKNDIKSSTKAPWLGSIPVLGYLFGGETTVKRSTDLVVVITPRFNLSNSINLATPPRVKTLDMMLEGKDCPPQGAPSLTFGYDQWLLDCRS